MNETKRVLQTNDNSIYELLQVVGSHALNECDRSQWMDSKQIFGLLRTQNVRFDCLTYKPEMLNEQFFDLFDGNCEKVIEGMSVEARRIDLGKKQKVEIRFHRILPDLEPNTI